VTTLLCRHNSLRQFKPSSGQVSAVLGAFDGLHSGHTKLLLKLLQEKERKGGCSVLVSFYPRPSQVLDKSAISGEISSLREKIEILKTHQVDYLYLIHFTPSFSRIRASDFIDEVLIESLNVATLIIGPDAHVGFKREGDPDFIKAYLEKRGRAVHVLDFLRAGGQKISSGTIRSLLKEGKVSDASQQLGRPFTLEGRVISGEKRGRIIGFPTANICPAKQLLPANGSYITEVLVADKWYQAATNVGINPTFELNRPVVESHLLTYRGPDFYGQRIKVKFRSKIRDEKKFGSIDQLKEQIKNDLLAVEHYFNE